jgi:predicted ATPase/DNA-binding winged helix-turn-helix (wHTH) protein
MSVPVENAVGERLKFGEFELATVARALWRRGEKIKLGSRALDILIALASRPGEIVSKNDLTQLVWRGALVDETSLRVGISSVRKALGDGGDHYIATVPGRGYCFVLDVETATRPTTERPHVKRLKPQRLPAQIARVVGRDDVIVALAAETTRHRLLSLVGTGGIGKTTVAIAVAHRLRAEFDAVAFVDVAAIENEPQMWAATAAALGLDLRPRANVVGEIAEAVEDRRVLIILDNCEHVIDDAATFGEALLGSAPGVTILTTSRERLRAAGEWVHHLSPLEAPPQSSAQSVEKVRGYSAVELFEERAAFALGGYQIDDADAPFVAQICRRLDGIALAVELAAGRLPGLGVQELARSLQDCFSILKHGRRTALPRHQTLRATLDWSYLLLSPEDQVALRCLSVFNGSFTLEDAVFVMGPVIRFGEAGDRLTSLLEKSLVVARPAEGTFRYRLLDTTRAYGQDKLEESGEANPQRRRHAQRFLQVCLASTPEDQAQSSLRAAIADVRAALDWSLVRGGDVSLGVNLATAAMPVFLRLSLLREQRKHLDLALAHIPASTDTMPMSEEALRSEMALRFAVAQAEYYTEGQELTPEKQLLKAREIARNIGDKAFESEILWALYGQAGNVGSYGQALLYARLFEANASGSTDSVIRIRCNRILARVLNDTGQHTLAQQHAEQALRSDRGATPRIALHAYQMDDSIAARAILARILWLRGYPDDAKAVAEQCIAEAIQVGHGQTICWAIAFNLCPVAIWCGDFGQADALVSILLERSQQVFQHYHEWGLLYRRFLDQAIFALGQVGADRHSGIKPEVPAQVDLFSTFDSRYADPDSLARAQGEEDTWCAPELLRTAALRLVLSDGKNAHGAAEAILLRSLELAKRQDAKAWELRTATSLASLYVRSSRSHEARALLEPMLMQFKQGHGTRDFQAAISVLSALSDCR